MGVDGFFIFILQIFVDSKFKVLSGYQLGSLKESGK